MAHSREEAEAVQWRHGAQAVAVAADVASTSEGGRVLIVPRQAGSAGASPAPAAPEPHRSALYKSRLCRHFMDGHCAHGSSCNYAHGEQELRPPGLGSASSGGGAAGLQRAAPGSAAQPAGGGRQHGRLYKTALCHRFVTEGACGYGSSCTFAHGEHELRPAPEQLPGVCAYWLEGRCKRGSMCHFRHSKPEGQRAPEPGEQQQSAGARLAGSMQPPTLPQEQQYLQQQQQQACTAGRPPGGAAPDEADEISALLHGTFLYSGGAAEADAGRHSAGQASVFYRGEASPWGAANGANGCGAFAAAGGAGLKGANGSGRAAGVAAAGAGTSAGRPAIDADLRSLLQRRFNSLLCPITLEPFEEPVLAADGNCYERRAIEEWLYRDGKDTSPLTNQRLPHKMLMPCAAVRKCLDDVLQYVVAMRQQVL